MTKSLRFRAAIAAAIAAGMTILSIKSSAFTTNGYIWTNSVMPYVVNPVNLDISPQAAIAAIGVGADAWPQQASINFAFSYAGQSGQTTNTYDGVNLVLFRNASSGSAIATTYTWFSGSSIVDADIVFWDGGFQFFSGTAGCVNGFYVEDIATHEFGHALGLGHSTSAAATMYPSTSACDMRNRSLDADDIAGARSLYPAARPSVPKNFRIIT